MNHHKKHTHRKSSASSTSSENNLLQNNEPSLCRTSQSSSSSSGPSAKKKLIYPNVPKRIQQQCSTINEHSDTIQTESEIIIIPTEIQSQKRDTYSSNMSSSNQNAYVRHTLDLITKYTSPQKPFSKEPHDQSLSSVQNRANNINNSQSINQSKSKRTLSPLNETNQQNHESKRTKSFDNDDDDDDNDNDELSQFLDYRCNKKLSSQNDNTTISSQTTTTTDGEERKPTVRKPTVRKLSINQQKPIVSQIVPIEQPIVNTPTESDEILIIEPDVDTEEENTIDREGILSLAKHSQNSNTESKDHLKNSKSNPIIPSPIRLPIDNHIDSLNSTNENHVSITPIKNSNSIYSPSNNISKQILNNSINNFSPGSNFGRRRRYSSTSTTSFLYDTPCSSFSRTTTNNTILNSQININNECETQTLLPTNIDMIHQLILQMNSNINENEYNIDYNSMEISKKLFHQSASLFSTNKYQTIPSLIKKQFFNIGRYEIEVPFPMNSNKIPIIYACDICLKHFHGSSIAFQRHTSKCLSIQPPGKLVYNENDLAIFEIGQTKLNIEQRIYIKSLCRIARLFIDSNKKIQFYQNVSFKWRIYAVVIIICQGFRILTFSLSFYCYFLIRSNASENLIYSSPARPLDITSLSAFRNYWCDIVLTHIINHNQSSIKTITLDNLARQTFIHPKDILSSLYSNGFIVPHSNDKSSVYLLDCAYQSISSKNLHIRNKSLFMNMKLINTDDEKKIMIDKNNNDKNHDSGIEEIVLD
ncbi:unnamed protein product [Rotaria sordida]|uniref:histone acetyltransferase n=1 Tax=Rotaria sordida TaxID=392033 RepID=A0A813SGM7_9BILA|nr:unnamed protein product [Rotaria sordida]